MKQLFLISAKQFFDGNHDILNYSSVTGLSLLAKLAFLYVKRILHSEKKPLLHQISCIQRIIAFPSPRSPLSLRLDVRFSSYVTFKKKTSLCVFPLVRFLFPCSLPCPYAFGWVLFRVFSAVVSALRLSEFSGLLHGSVLLRSQISYFQNFQCSIFSLLGAIIFFFWGGSSAALLSASFRAVCGNFTDHRADPISKLSCA